MNCLVFRYWLARARVKREYSVVVVAVIVIVVVVAIAITVSVPFNCIADFLAMFQCFSCLNIFYVFKVGFCWLPLLADGAKLTLGKENIVLLLLLL